MNWTIWSGRFGEPRVLRMILVNLTTRPRAGRATLGWDGIHLTLILGFLPDSPEQTNLPLMMARVGRMVAHGGLEQSRYNRAHLDNL